jgi:hypothetical protein
MRDIVAPLVIGEEGLAALADPAHRAAEAAGGPQHEDIFGVDGVLEAEAAADIADEDADAILVEMEGAGEMTADAMRHLRGSEQGEAAGHIVPFADGAAGFQRRHDDAAIDDIDARDALGFGEGGIGCRAVAGLPAEGGVARCLRPDLRRAGGGRRFRTGHRVERLVIDRDQLGGVARRLERIGDDHRHALADETHALARQAGEGRMNHGEGRGGARRVEGQGEMRRNAADAVRRQLRPGQHGEHAGRLPCRLGIDGAYVGMGVRRAQDECVAFAVDALVGDEAPVPGQQARVFLAPNRLTPAELTHD